MLYYYLKKTLLNIYSSKFIYNTLEKLPKNIKLDMKIPVDQKLIEKGNHYTIYYYSWLITEKKPYIKKTRLSRKMRLLRHWNKLGKNRRLKSEIIASLEKKRKLCVFLSKSVSEIIEKQFSSDLTLINPNYKKFLISLNINQGILIKKTANLLYNTNAFHDFRIILNLKIQTDSLYEKIYLLKHFNCLKESEKIEWLESDPEQIDERT